MNQPIVQMKAIFVLIFLTICSIGFSQSKNRLGMTLLGTNSKTVGYDMVSYLSNDTPKNSISAGISYQSDIGSKVGCTIAINYLNIGTGFNDAPADGFFDFEDPEVDVAANLHYVQIPVTIDINLARERMFYLKGGFYISALLSGKIDGNLGEYSVIYGDESIDLEITDDLKGFDFGLTIGLASHFKINDQFGIAIGTGYNYGLLNIEPDGNLPGRNGFVKEHSLKNRFFMAEVGLTYNLKTVLNKR